MYFGILFFCIFGIIVANLAVNLSWAMALNLLLGFVIILLPSLFCAIIIRILPKKWFNYNNKIYNVGEKERQFLLKIGIKKWKDKIPELGQTVNFKKNKLIDANNPSYLEKFLTETCYAECLHISCVVCALIGMFFVPGGNFWNIAFPIAFVYSVYNIPSILIQRYNRPRLKVQLKRLTKIYNNDIINRV